MRPRTPRFRWFDLELSTPAWLPHDGRRRGRVDLEWENVGAKA